MGYIGKSSMSYEWLRGVWYKKLCEKPYILSVARSKMIKEYGVEPLYTHTGNHYFHHFKVVDKLKFIHKMLEEM